MLKKLTKSILAFALIVCSFALVACKKDNNSNSETPSGKTVEKIELLTTLATSFYVGDELDIDEAKIKVTYTDQTTEEIVITSQMVSGFDTASAGEKSLTITYGSKTISVPYTVAELTITSLSVKTPFKTEYYEGEELFVDDGVATISYINGTSKDVVITDEHISNFSTAEVGDKILTLTIEGKSIEVSYKVKELLVESIAIKTPFKTSYFVGEPLTVDGSELTVTYNNGNTIDIEILAEMISDFNSETAGNLMLTLTYGGKTISNISCQIKAIEVVSVTLKETFKKTEYYVGEPISLDGNYLVLKYNNDTTEEIEVKDTMIVNFNTTSAGSKQFQISHLGSTILVDYTVTAVVATNIELSSEFTKTTYYVGETISIDDAKILVHYNNGTEETLDVDIDMIRDFSTSTAGTFEFVVEYHTLTINVPYTVTGIEITEVTLSSPFTKTTYYYGQELDLSGGMLTIKYNYGDDTTIAVTKQMVKSFSTEVDSTRTKKMKITYEGFTIEFEYTVICRLINLYSTFDQTTYSVGEELKVTGGKLIITYDNGTPEEIVDITAEMVSGFDSSTAGTRQLTITYGGVSLEGIITYVVE